MVCLRICGNKAKALKNYTNLSQLLGDGEINIAMAFNFAQFSNDIKGRLLPDTVRTYIHEEGTLANIHYVAIPFNAKSSDAGMIAADFLLSPEAQIRKANLIFGVTQQCYRSIN